ncbi:MAG: hypothetical protein LBU09_00230 [Endomicrobium sp.]|nr:hypothetical protein [Endomicrobium sp.]
MKRVLERFLNLGNNEKFTADSSSKLPSCQTSQLFQRFKMKYFLALFITIILGPGIGHFTLGRLKKGAVLLGLALLCVVVMAVILALNSDMNAIPQDYALMIKYVKNLISQNSNKMYIADIPLAVIWAYALLDIAAEAVFEYRKTRELQK